MEGYAVSGQCMALVRDNCLVPTKDAPELGYVRESTDKQYVPDVFYKVSLIFTYLIRFKCPLCPENDLRPPTLFEDSRSQSSWEIKMHFETFF